MLIDSLRSYSKEALLGGSSGTVLNATL